MKPLSLCLCLSLFLCVCVCVCVFLWERIGSSTQCLSWQWVLCPLVTASYNNKKETKKSIMILQLVHLISCQSVSCWWWKKQKTRNKPTRKWNQWNSVAKVKSVKQLLLACYDRLVLLAVENEGKEGGQFQAQQVMCPLWPSSCLDWFMLWVRCDRRHV